MKYLFILILAVFVLGLVGVIDSVIESYIPWMDDFVLTTLAAITIIVFITTLLEK